VTQEPIERLRAALAGRYEILREIGSGGMATVYLATDMRHQRQVALKVLRPELTASLGHERFLQEVRLTAKLQHPHILPLFDSGEAGGFIYYVMPFVDGESLRDRLAREGELPVPEAARLLRDVVEALAAAHAQGIVHRDVKPENILLSGRNALVADFGVAKAVSRAGGHALTTAGVALGTPAYMAPEQAAANENIDHRADIYAVGAVAFELLTGVPPFTGRTPQQILAAQVTEKPTRLTERRPAVPPGLETLVMRCLEKKAADRWQRAEEMLPHLDSFTTPDGLTPAAMAPVGAKTRRSSWKTIGVPVAAALAVLALWLARPLLRASDDSASEAVAPAGEPRRLIVVPLDNISDGPEEDIWARLAADEIARAIDKPRPVDVVPSVSVRDVTRALGENWAVAEVAEGLGARWAVTGSLARTGNRVRFLLEFHDVRSGDLLRALEPVVGPADSIEAVVGRLADLAAAASVALLDPGRPPWFAAGSLPPSVQVYRNYLTQVELHCRGQWDESVEVGNRIRLRAPDYIPALMQIRMTASLRLLPGRQALVDSLTQVLEGMRDRMTAVEAAEQDWMWGRTHGDRSLMMRGAEEMYRLDPSRGYITGVWNLYDNRLELALERLQSLDLNAHCLRDWATWYWATGSAYHLLSRFEEQLRGAHEGLRRHPGERLILEQELMALAGLGRVEAVDSLLEFIAELPPDPDGGNEGQLAVTASLELRAHGNPQAADDLVQRAIAWYAQRPSISNGRAFAFMAAGRWADADTLLLANPDNGGNLSNRGVALAKLGRRDEALEMSRRLEALHVRPGQSGLIAGQAQIAAALGNREAAVALLRRAFDDGFGYGVGFHRDPAYEGMWGYAPWDNLVRPRP
jgi:TolB-like protein